MKKILLLILLSLFGFINEVLAEPMQSANYILTPIVISSGGGTSTSSSFQLDGSVGQSTPPGISSSASYTMATGFWYQLLKLIAGGDVNGDDQVDLQDAILALKVLSQLSSSGVFIGADVDGDRAIGAAEVIYILQSIGAIR
jgi:hypothetical protein